MKVTVVDIKNKKVGEVELSKKVFGIEPNFQVLAQYVRVYLANQRSGTASTKTRAEVSGGGAKPRVQKGTGRSRQGSIRSPLWVHGGVAHGPKPKSWKLTLPKKMISLALKSALSQKAMEKSIVVLAKIELKAPKTRELFEALNALGLEGKTLFVWVKPNENLKKAASNIKALKLVYAGNINAYDILNCKHIVFLQDALKFVEDKYENK